MLYDTLLTSADEREIKLIVAHELGHRRERHVAKGTLLAMASVVIAVVAVWAVLGSRVASPDELPGGAARAHRCSSSSGSLPAARCRGAGSASPTRSRST